MYTQFFGLSENPFRLTPDPRFLYFTSKHSESLAALVYGVLSRKGFMVVTGDAGTGKTTLIHALLGMLTEKKVSCAFIFHPLLEPAELLEYVLADLGVKPPSSQKGEMLRTLHSYLLKRHQEGSTTVLILDEAHKLAPSLLEEIRLFSNLETSRDKLLQIVLTGQSELDDLFRRDDLRQLKQRIGLRSRLEPFDASQTAEYLQHRIGLCGREAGDLFPPGAMAAVYQFSRGIPRLINSICDNALLLAFAQQSPAVSRAMVAEVAGDLDLSAPGPVPAPLPAGDVSAQQPADSPGVPSARTAGRRGRGRGARARQTQVELLAEPKTIESNGEPKRTLNILSRWASRFGLQ